MKQSDFKTVMKYAETDTKLPENLDDIMICNNNLPTIKYRWLKIYTKQRDTVERLKIEKNQLYGKWFKYYKFEDNFSWQSDKQIDIQIHNNKEFVEKLQHLAEQQYYLDFVENVFRDVNDMSYTIKNYLEYKQMLQT